MKWSYSLGRVFGIRIAVHVSFVLVLAWTGWLGWQEQGAAGAVWAVALTGLLFLCVVLHELGHSVVAQAFGIPVKSITLLPIGGVAAMARIPERPIQEFLIAVAGPMVNVVIVGLILLTPVSLAPNGNVTVFPTDIASLVQRLAWANIMLVVFNLLPAFPMDGGRILRSLLAMVLSYRLATRIASVLGQAMAFVFLCMGLMWNPFLILIAVFVFFGARSESRMIAVRETFRGVKASDLMTTVFDTVDARDPLWQCRILASAKGQEGFPVLNNGSVVGLLGRDSLGQQADPGALASDAMLRRFISFAPAVEMLHGWQDILALPQRVFPVLEKGHLVGIITPRELHAFLVSHGAGPRGGSRSPGPPPVPFSRRPSPSSQPRRSWRIDLG